MIDFIITMLGGYTRKEYLAKACESSTRAAHEKVLENRIKELQQQIMLLSLYKTEKEIIDSKRSSNND